MAIKPKITKGILPVVYTNKDGTVIVKYRIRLQRKKDNIKIDELFDELKDAQVFQSRIKDKDYRDKWLIDREYFSKELTKSGGIFSDIMALKLDGYLLNYLNKYSINKRGYKNEKYLLENVIPNVIIKKSEFYLPSTWQLTGGFEKRFGDIHIDNLTTTDINLYIDERLKIVSKATVKRELGLLSHALSKLRVIEPYYADKYRKNADKEFINPVLDYDKDKLKGWDIKRDRRLNTNEETALFSAISTAKNPEFAVIIAIAVECGLRRSEILGEDGLTWHDIDYAKKTINIKGTKTQASKRIVPLTESIYKALKMLEAMKTNEKVFQYTAEGFKTVWQRIRTKSKVSNFQFRDLRHEFISNLIEQNMNVWQVRGLSGYSNMSYMSQRVLKPAMREQTIRKSQQGLALDNSEIMSIAGHNRINTTDRYTHIDQELMNSVDPELIPQLPKEKRGELLKDMLKQNQAILNMLLEQEE